MRILTLLGARPQFIKASVLSRAFSAAGIEESIVHSGQHYGTRVSQIFFDELNIPKPVTNLRVGSHPHSIQTAKIMMGLNGFIEESNPFDYVLVYGDTNTTIAGALVAAKRNIPVIHVEAGLRSFNRTMPEEINRIVTDRVSTLLFCPTETAVANLHSEGMRNGVFLSGDVMYDATNHFSELAERRVDKNFLDHLDSMSYYLLTIHRAANTDDPDLLESLLRGIERLGKPVLFPVHPRTRVRIKNIKLSGNINILEPASYLEMLSLIKNARAVITDSGGLQKEAYWLRVPCVTLRQETEWTETLQGGWNQLVGSDIHLIQKAISSLPEQQDKQRQFGLASDGRQASDYIANLIKDL